MAKIDPATFKMGRYKGKGEPLDKLIIGEHAPQNSPFHYFPALPKAAMLLNPSWQYMDSYDGYIAGDWTVTTVGAGSSAAAQGTGADRGILLTTDAGANDLVQLQHLLAWTPAANAWCAMYCRLQASEATNAIMWAGLSSTDTTIVANEPADYAMFKKDDDDTILNGRTNDAGGAGSETANLLTNWTAATDYDLGVVLRSSSTTAGVAYFCYKLASANAWSMVTKATDFPDAAVRLTFLLQNGSANARTQTIKRWAYASYAG